MKDKKDVQKLKIILESGEKKEVFIKTWHDHVKSKDEIASFTTIVKDTLFNVAPRKNELIIPFSEFHGEYDICWILIIDKDTGKEITRKNIKNVDMVEWKLSSSSIN